MKLLTRNRILKIHRKFYAFLSDAFNHRKAHFLGVSIGKGVRLLGTLHLDIDPLAHVDIGEGVTLTSGTTFNPLSDNRKMTICAERAKAKISIGANTGISSSCLWAKESITIGAYVNIGANCILMDSDAHNLDWCVRRSRELVNGISIDVLTAATAPIVIEDDVFIGTQSIILKGVVVGARSIIAAGSVVTQNIPPDCIAGGCPCRVIKSLTSSKPTSK